MKTNKTPLTSAATIAALGLALVFSGCSKTRDASTDTAATTTSSSPHDTTLSNTAAGVAADWDALKGYSYEQRSEFASKANDYAAQLDRQIQNAKGDASNRLAEARDELRTAANEVSNATADTWEATKERVGRAWQKAQSAYQAAE